MDELQNMLMKEARHETLHVFHFQEMPKKGKFMKTEEDKQLPSQWEWELTVSGHKGTCQNEGNVLKLVHGHNCSFWSIYKKSLPLKWENSICKIYLNEAVYRNKTCAVQPNQALQENL